MLYDKMLPETSYIQLIIDHLSKQVLILVLGFVLIRYIPGVFLVFKLLLDKET